MTTRDHPWKPGTPCWVDLVTPDVDAAAGFYSEIFGWDSQPGPPEAAGYRLCMLAGRPTAGIGPGPRDRELPSVWSTYLSTTNADATAAAITAHGGSLMLAPFDVLDVGRMAVAFDPSGCAFGLWEAKSHIGSAIVNQPGALTWNECMTRDYDRALAFYGSVFGHAFDEIGDASFRYATISVDGSVVGGIGELSTEMAPELPSHWMTYFACDDVARSVARAVSAGAVLRTGPMETPRGRMAVVEGPQGEIFSVLSASS
jgi:predicted enzyme related to lactoylglutathione lyase